MIKDDSIPDQPRLPAVEIIPFIPGHKEAIRTLNYEWLEKYFFIEPNDIIQLSDPIGEIIEKGGHIYYARCNDEIIGTSSLMKINDDEYELAKMAVTEKYKGIGAGRLLMEHCISEATRLNAKKLTLYSNTKLEAAINLYRSYGFYEVPPSPDVHYIRSNIKMEKLLNGENCI